MKTLMVHNQYSGVYQYVNWAPVWLLYFSLVREYLTYLTAYSLIFDLVSMVAERGKYTKIEIQTNAPSSCTDSQWLWMFLRDTKALQTGRTSHISFQNVRLRAQFLHAGVYSDPGFHPWWGITHIQHKCYCLLEKRPSLHDHFIGNRKINGSSLPSFSYGL